MFAGTGGGGGGGGGGEQQHNFGYTYWDPPPLLGHPSALGQVERNDHINFETPAARVARLRAELAAVEKEAAAEVEENIGRERSI